MDLAVHISGLENRYSKGIRVGFWLLTYCGSLAPSAPSWAKNFLLEDFMVYYWAYGNGNKLSARVVFSQAARKIRLLPN